MKNCIRAEDETFVSPPVLSTGPLPTLQQDTQGRLLCKCPACGDEWRVSTWPKLESDAKAQGWEEAMERVEEIERHSVDKALSYAIAVVEGITNDFQKPYLSEPRESKNYDPGAWMGFQAAQSSILASLDGIRRQIRLRKDIYRDNP